MSDHVSAFSKPNSFTQPLFDQLKRHPKRIVFSDAEDERILRVAERMVELELGIPILLGNKEKICGMAEELGVKMDFVRVIQPELASDFPLFCDRLENIERYRGIKGVNAKEIMKKPDYFAAMMVQYGQADACLSGNQSTPAGVFRPLLHLIAPDPKVKRVFAVTILVSETLQHFGNGGTLFLSDCGLVAEPTVEELASIAEVTGQLARHHLGRRVRVAMLSHSTHGTSVTAPALKVKAATELARQHVPALEIEVDGEIQADVALDASAAEVKLPQQERKAPADVLIFPSLDAAHISLKLLQHVGGAQNYGQLICGLMRPAAQVPRTASVETILGTAAALGVEAIKFHDLYPKG
ncbi:MAG: phosphate acyltransferase [Verrucomicrobiaceae bacterium]